MASCRKNVFHFFGEYGCADWKTAAKTLCCGEYIRVDVKVLMCKKLACSAVARLNLIDEEQDIIFDFVSLCEGMSWRLLELVCATKESPSE